MNASLESCPALVLNADCRPLSYFPLSLWPWQNTIKAVFLERVNVLSEYDRQVHSPNWAVNLPSVISLKRYIVVAKRPAFTRFNVFLRDRFSCQYCGDSHVAYDLTFDHVLPRSRGGRTTWDNVVTACMGCNLKKSARLPAECGMQPRIKPDMPSIHRLQRNGRGFPPNYLHDSWRDFLYWDTELESG